MINLKSDINHMFNNKVKANVIARLSEYGLDYNDLKGAKKQDLIDKERERLETKTEGVVIGAFISFLLFGF